MVVGAFPAAKLGALLLKQISKPIANIVKSQAKSSPVFRKYVCMPPAHFYNWCEVKSKMWILNLGKPVNIPVLNEAMAIELGANLLGEGIIFIIAAGILISEYNRSSNKEAAKEEAKQKEMAALQNTIMELSRRLENIEDKMPKKPVTPRPSPPSPPPPSPPPPSSPPPSSPSTEKNIITSIQSHPSDQKNKISQNLSKNDGLILKAIDDVHNQFWSYPLVEREDSVLFLSLYYIEKLLRFQQ